MSLDVYLEVDHPVEQDGSGIWIRENGSNVQISREEWNQRFPDWEPVVVTNTEPSYTVYHGNITHNLGKMAQEAGIYECLWRSDEHGITRAKELLDSLSKGFVLMRDNPERFRAFDSPNGWGTYDDLLQFVGNYMAACAAYPDASVRVWR